jgi:hypothetical protein
MTAKSRGFIPVYTDFRNSIAQIEERVARLKRKRLAFFVDAGGIKGIAETG